ncbi:hypothetical protein D3C86_2072510 [compost metagenome]
MDHLHTVLPAFGFSIRQHTPSGGKAIFHRGAEIEKPHRENSGTIADLAGHHATTAEGDAGVQDFTFHSGINAWKQIANSVKLSAIFVTQGKVQE